MSVECVSVGLLVADHLCTPIPRLPQAGELVLAEALPLQIGGCASNAAMDLARLGVRVSVVGCVGQDAFGQFIVDTLRSKGIETSGIRRLHDVSTSGTLIINVVGEDRRFIHAVGANARITVEDIPPASLDSAKVLYVGGYLLMPGLDPHKLADLFRRARQRGVKTVLDVVLPGPGAHWPALSPVLPHADVFLPNTDEARTITGLSDPFAQADCFRAAGAETVVITCGGEGTVLVNSQQRLRAGVFDVPYVGATGAGDAFDAGYIAGLLWDRDARGCLEIGSALGASCVRSIGATESVFTRAEAETFLQKNRLPITQL